MTQTTQPDRQPTRLQQQIETIREDLGPVRKTRGAKVRLAAIRFEENFRGLEPFTTEQFNEWLVSDPGMVDYLDDSTVARNRLQAAGYRDDMPHPFEIHRVAMSKWKLRPVTAFLLSAEIAEETRELLEKQFLKVKHHLQSCDIDSLPVIEQFQVVSSYQNYLRSREDILRLCARMDNDVAQIGWLTTPPALENV